MDTVIGRVASVGATAPDDWSAAQEGRYYALLHEIEVETHKKVRDVVIGVLSGVLPQCRMQTPFGFRNVNAVDIFRAVTEELRNEDFETVIPGYDDDLPLDEMAKLLASSPTNAAKALIDEYCQLTAHTLAFWQMMQEGL
ncbi:hypothetical protein [Allopusillimonas ginsengisoli]|uniref:hypothetical protein n=1 Tax=Allopusillimonas ginsengisoli TaxID=453575 RepID=UPI00101EFFD6|nr:hypothetical protein [Allopusillimonas ginsengisoli]TEA78673.1 hypothetical protein ERE07_09775 [Allopusillimonas ginsengisoli]